MSVNFNLLYHDRTLAGEHLLAPFKHSIQRFGHAFKVWTERESANRFTSLMTRIADFVVGLFCMIGTSIIVPVGMAIKSFSKVNFQENNYESELWTDLQVDHHNEITINEIIQNKNIKVNLFVGRVPAEQLPEKRKQIQGGHL